jgi:cardiolipin synthase
MILLSFDKLEVLKKQREKLSFKRIFSILLHRVVLVSLMIIAQVAVIVLMIVRFSIYFSYFYLICLVISLLVALYILCNRGLSDYKIAWLVPILLFPLFGGLLYLVLGRNRVGFRKSNRFRTIDRKGQQVMAETPDARPQLEAAMPQALKTSDFIRNSSSYPICQGESNYYSLGDEAFPQILEALRGAEHFIFLEYFIIQPGKMWDSILDILTEKAAQGVDVRVIYDDFGSMLTLPPNYDRKLHAKGIQCVVFNPFIPVLSTRLNNRDHRKLLIVDGKIGFTGGYNLADEYINHVVRFGHWKDSGLRFTGEAVWSITVMFLSMWDSITGQQTDFQRYHAKFQIPQIDQGEGSEDSKSALTFLQPYCVHPSDADHLAESVLLGMIDRANRYIYFTTPYLVIDETLCQALCRAAKSGVDVRIITPHIPDKKLVFELTRANYVPLLEAGVRIYEYTPGFMHSKNVVADDQYAIVGTINLDYRSLFLHYECGVFLCGSETVLQVRDDIQSTIQLSQEVTMDEIHPGPLKRLYRALLRVLAPLL